MTLKSSARSLWAFVFGQAASLFGSRLSRFAIGISIYQQTGSIGLFSAVAIASMLPGILLSPLAGVIVDRYSRKKTLLATNAVCGASLFTMFALVQLAGLSPLLLLVGVAVTSACEAFQWPALRAFLPELAKDQHLSKANGMLETCESVSLLAAPAIGGLLLAGPGLSPVLLIVTAAFFISLLLLATVQTDIRTRQSSPTQTGIIKEAKSGLTYLLNRHELVSLLIIFSTLNFFITIFTTLRTPFTLEIATAREVGWISSAFGLGMLCGGSLLSTWGGPKRKVRAILFTNLGIGITVIVSGLFPTIPVLIALSAVGGFLVPLTNGFSQTLWQSHVENDFRGRVFALRRMVSWITVPIANAIAAPLSHAYSKIAGGASQASAMQSIIVIVGIAITMMMTWYALTPCRVKVLDENHTSDDIVKKTENIASC